MKAMDCEGQRSGKKTRTRARVGPSLVSRVLLALACVFYPNICLSPKSFIADLGLVTWS